MFRISALLATAVVLAGCQPTAGIEPQSTPTVQVVEESGWRRLASSEDEARVDGAAEAWDEALAVARRAGFRRQIAAEGRLLEPDGALPRAAPSPGSYNCRLLRFANPSGRRGRSMTAFPPFFCHVGVDADQLSITKQTGSERPSGYLWDEPGTSHMVFLGSLALGSDEAPLAYGDDQSRDMAGLFERVGPLRFRLVIPRPRTGAILEIFELTPAPAQPVE